MKCSMAFLMRISLRKKLIASYLLLILLPMSLLGSVSYASLRNVLITQNGNAYLEAVRQTATSVDLVLQSYLNAANLTCSNERLLSLLRILRRSKLSPGEEYDYYQQICAIKDTLLNQRGVLSVRLALQGEATFISDAFEIFGLPTLLQDAAYPLITQDPGAHWLPSTAFDTIRIDDPNSYVLCVRIVDFYGNNHTLGYLLVQIAMHTLFFAPQSFALPEGANLTLQTDEQVIFSAGASLPDTTCPSPCDAITQCAFQGRTYMQYCASIDTPQWQLLLRLPQSQLLLQTGQLPAMLLWMALLLSTLAILFALLLTQNINRRLETVLDQLQCIEEGALGLTHPVCGTDEYARLQAACNHMSLRIHALVQDLIVSQEKQKQTEMRLLYEQINPHFLYNTLDIIKWEARRNNAQSLADLVDALTRYLRLSLNHGYEYTTVSCELDEITQYLHIMNYRYRNAITFSTSREEGIDTLCIPKLLLQPLVENAVLHGVMCKEEKRGNIDVNVRMEGDDLLLMICDDGIGMTQSQCDTLLLRSDAHYGIWNVHRRIQARYGVQSGLSFVSAPGKGCTVTLRLAQARTISAQRSQVDCAGRE